MELDGKKWIYAVNSEKTIFMKHSGSEYIIHGLFVDDMMHIYSCDAIKDEFMQLYSKDFEITGGRKMKTFLGMQVEQTARSIKIHLDHYIKEEVEGYAEYIKKALRPKKVPIAAMSSSSLETPLRCQIPANRSSIVLLWQSFSSQPHGSDSTLPSRYHSWLGFAHRLDRRTGQRSYRRSKGRSNLLSGYADADWGNSCSRRSTSGTLMLYNKDHVEVEDAENYGSLYGRGRVLLRIYDRY
jgi:hypothetical protein